MPFNSNIETQVNNVSDMCEQIFTHNLIQNFFSLTDQPVVSAYIEVVIVIVVVGRVVRAIFFLKVITLTNS